MSTDSYKQSGEHSSFTFKVKQSKGSAVSSYRRRKYAPFEHQQIFTSRDNKTSQNTCINNNTVRTSKLTNCLKLSSCLVTYLSTLHYFLLGSTLLVKIAFELFFFKCTLSCHIHVGNYSKPHEMKLQTHPYQLYWLCKELY
jgi:hypothetical protein